MPPTTRRTGANQVQEASDRDLVERIRQVHEKSRICYGSPRVTAQLNNEGVVIDRPRVAILMRKAGIQGRSARLSCHAKVGKREFFASVPSVL